MVPFLLMKMGGVPVSAVPPIIPLVVYGEDELMTYDTLIHLVLARARRMQLKNPETGLVDSADIELAIYSNLLDLLGRYDLDAFTVINREMFITSPGVDEYALPEDFGRFITPRDRDEFGLGLDDGNTQQPSPLVYRRPDEFEALRTHTNGRPRYYTITAYRHLRLDPPPDSNGGDQYFGVGVYVRDILPEELEEGMIPLTYGNILQHAALSELTLDLGHPSWQAARADKDVATTALINTQQRQRTKFQKKNTTIGRTYRSWRL